MCYDLEYYARKQFKEARYRGAPKSELDRLWNNLREMERRKYGIDPLFDPDWVPEKDEVRFGDYYHVSGFSRPYAIILTDATKPTYELAKWGFVPFWVKTEAEIKDYKKPYNLNLNAQCETMFSSRSFSNAAKYKRCVMQIDAYYEHHDYKGKKYPFHISGTNGQLWVAGIYEHNEITDEETGEAESYITFAIITTKANEILSRIHNNPKMVARTGHRMLTILHEDQLADYLRPYPDTTDQQEERLFQESIINLCQPYEEECLRYRTVRNIKPRKEMTYLGNVPEITDEYLWPELDLASILN